MVSDDGYVIVVLRKHVFPHICELAWSGGSMSIRVGYSLPAGKPSDPMNDKPVGRKGIVSRFLQYDEAITTRANHCIGRTRLLPTNFLQFI